MCGVPAVDRGDCDLVADEFRGTPGDHGGPALTGAEAVEAARRADGAAGPLKRPDLDVLKINGKSGKR